MSRCDCATRHRIRKVRHIVRLPRKTQFGAKPGHPTNLSLDEKEKLADFACNIGRHYKNWIWSSAFLSFAKEFATKKPFKPLELHLYLGSIQSYN